MNFCARPTDMHTHTTFSHDGIDDIFAMAAEANRQKMAFFGISEHFDLEPKGRVGRGRDLKPTDDYFVVARSLKEQYENEMEILVGAEFSFSQDESVQKRCAEIVEKFAPDFVINSVHDDNFVDFIIPSTFLDENGNVKPKQQVYGRYLDLVLASLDAKFPYDIVGHIGYVGRYGPYEQKVLRYEEFSQKIDLILQGIIARGKVLEVNSAIVRRGEQPPKGLCCVPEDGILKRYFELGGREVSFGSDAHNVIRVGENREQVARLLKSIGFGYVTVPRRGAKVRVEL